MFLDIEFTEDEVNELTKNLLTMGKSMGHKPEKLAILLSICSQQLLQTHGMAIDSMELKPGDTLQS
jgi:hypothetical protein